MTDNTGKEQLIRNLGAVMEAFASVAGQNLEVVLHDLTQPEASVLKIINGHVSGRAPGSSLLDGPEHDMGFMGLLDQQASSGSTEPTVFRDYRTVSLQGKTLRSSTVLFKDASGNASLSLCFNADHSAIDAAREALLHLLPPVHDLKEQADTSLEAKMDELIRACIPPTGQLRTGASKKEKVAIVRQMQEKGLFIVRGGVEKAAKVLGVTRYTIYNYLDEIKKSEQAAE